MQLKKKLKQNNLGIKIVKKKVTIPIELRFKEQIIETNLDQNNECYNEVFNKKNSIGFKIQFRIIIIIILIITFISIYIISPDTIKNIQKYLFQK